jgi:hypothetical protein
VKGAKHVDALARLLTVPPKPKIFHP